MTDLGVCKFCGCTDENPCMLPFTRDDGEMVMVGCGWLTDDVCSAPGCVERAYLEARELAEDLAEILTHLHLKSVLAR